MTRGQPLSGRFFLLELGQRNRSPGDPRKSRTRSSEEARQQTGTGELRGRQTADGVSGLQASVGDAEVGTEKKEMSLSGCGAGGWRGG